MGKRVRFRKREREREIKKEREKDDENEVKGSAQKTVINDKKEMRSARLTAQWTDL